jgi:hypothetical protein
VTPRKNVGKYCIEQSRNTSDRRFDYISSGFRTSFGGGMQSRKALLGNTQHKTEASERLNLVSMLLPLNEHSSHCNTDSTGRNFHV